MARKLRLEFPGAIYHASNRWLTEHLQLGTPIAVSQYVSVFRHHRSSDQSFIQQFTEKLKA